MAVENLIVIPKCNDKNGHPVKLAPQIWNELLKIDINSEEARLDCQIKKVSNTRIAYLSVLDSSVIKNLNTLFLWDSYLKSSSKK